MIAAVYTKCSEPPRNACWNIPGTKFYALNPSARPCAFYATGVCAAK